ncbi:MAG TPA: M20 family metallo-hydrolase [Candidatus Dormibacteraeota bacterium]|nr:M20 family metallo-hydrolase [Candidatus Dormibacteraeota bacterium]
MRQLHERLQVLGEVGREGEGIVRPLCSAAEHRARELLASWARDAGFSVEQDAVGNLFVRKPGCRDLPPVQTGSHLDTVKGGGRYDGAYGVVGGLCALEALAERGMETAHPVELVAWAGEEGSRFPVGCLGSSVYAGLIGVEAARALRGDDGTTFADALRGTSGLLAGVPVREGSATPSGYVELHIEQGPILERAGLRLGVVTAIAGQRRLRVVIDGEPGHAGTVPMAYRHDAFAAAAELALGVEQRARRIGDCVATVGRVVVEPNQTNVVPGRVELRFDVRSVDDGRVEAVVDELERLSRSIAGIRGVRIAVEALEERAATPMDARLRGAVGAVVERLGHPAFDVPSGAGHDAMCLAAVAPVAMIFVPSIGGVSHVGHERTAPEDLALGVEALAAAIAEIDRLV